MRADRLWVLSFVLALGCASSESDEGPIGVAGGGAHSSGGVGGVAPNSGAAGAPATPNGGSGGAAPSGGGAGAPASGGTSGGLSNGGTGGSSSSAGGRSASMSGGPSTGGRGSGGPGDGGDGGDGGQANGGAAGDGGAETGGAPANGGAGSCVENLGCTLEAPASTGDLHQDCVDRINQFRTQCACLPPLARRTDGEACADQMAEYDADKNSAHAGVRDDICEPGGAQNSCPGYSSNNQVISLCLQQMWDEGPPPMDPCDGSCFQEYGHFINMTDTSTTQVACGFYTTDSGEVWAVQNFTR